LAELSQKLEEAIALRQETEAKLAHAEKKLSELEQLSGKGKVRKLRSHHKFIVSVLKNICV
jgi:chaperonin cofactor prefoldin